MFILKKMPYGESDLILQGLTAVGSRISLLARGALRSRKRFGGGVLEPTHFILAVYQQKNREMNLMFLQEAQLLEDFSALRADYEKLQLALHFLRLVTQVSHEGDVHSEELFNLLGNALKAAEKADDLRSLQIHFEVKLLALQGSLAVFEHESLLLQTPISQHKDLPLTTDEWRTLNFRVQRSLQNYLEHRSDLSRETQ